MGQCTIRWSNGHCAWPILPVGEPNGGSGAAPAVLLFETVVVRVVVREREAVVASLALLVATSFFLRQL